MIRAFLDIRAAAAASRYQRLLSTFDGALSLAMSQQDPTRPSVQKTLRASAAASGRDYIALERSLVIEDTFQIALRARDNARVDLDASATADELLPRTRAHLNAVSDAILEEKAAQISRDLAELDKTWRYNVMAILALQRVRRLSRRRAVIEHGIQNRTHPSFHFRDRAGRALKPANFARVVYRQHLLNAYNDSYIFEALNIRAFDTVRVHHKDPEHEHYGRDLAIVPVPGVELYEDKRSKIFHPNSNAVVRY